jgi:hypothetical protein
LAESANGGLSVPLGCVSVTRNPDSHQRAAIVHLLLEGTLLLPASVWYFYGLGYPYVATLDDTAYFVKMDQ